MQQICPWSLPGANLGSKRFAAQHIFSLQIVGADEGALLRERVAGACCGSKLPCVYRPLQALGRAYKPWEGLASRGKGLQAARKACKSQKGLTSRGKSLQAAGRAYKVRQRLTNRGKGLQAAGKAYKVRKGLTNRGKGLQAAGRAYKPREGFTSL